MSPSGPRIPLPKSWPIHVRVAILHVIALAQFATAHTRSWAANSVNARIRLQAERDRAVQELALQREETRIKDARMASINPHRRPHYPPAERLAILELKTARGWSLEQTARVFHLTAPTVASWLGRLDEEGPDANPRESIPRFRALPRPAIEDLVSHHGQG
jgi:hypothetical protein